MCVVTPIFYFGFAVALLQILIREMLINILRFHYTVESLSVKK